MIQNAEYYERLSEHKSLVLHEFIRDNFTQVSEKTEDRELIYEYANKDGEILVTIIFKDWENAVITMLETKRGRYVWFLTEYDEYENEVKKND